MKYENWLEKLELLKRSTPNNEILKELQNEPLNSNISSLLEPKILDLINYKLNQSINKISANISVLFSDINQLDLALINFKKEIKFIIELSNLKEITKEHQQHIQEEIQKEIEKIYNIFLEESLKYDRTGSFSLIIKNNKIKWSE